MNQCTGINYFVMFSSNFKPNRIDKDSFVLVSITMRFPLVNQVNLSNENETTATTSEQFQLTKK